MSHRPSHPFVRDAALRLTETILDLSASSGVGELTVQLDELLTRELGRVFELAHASGRSGIVDVAELTEEQIADMQASALEQYEDLVLALLDAPSISHVVAVVGQLERPVR